MITCIIASARAASVPGLMGRYQFAQRAVRVLYGSITTSFAPLRRASFFNGHRWMLVAGMFGPQAMRYLGLRKCSGAVPLLLPITVTQAPPPPAAPIGRF